MGLPSGKTEIFERLWINLNIIFVKLNMTEIPQTLSLIRHPLQLLLFFYIGLFLLSFWIIFISFCVVLVFIRQGKVFDFGKTKVNIHFLVFIIWVMVFIKDNTLPLHPNVGWNTIFHLDLLAMTLLAMDSGFCVIDTFILTTSIPSSYFC